MRKKVLTTGSDYCFLCNANIFEVQIVPIVTTMHVPIRIVEYPEYTKNTNPFIFHMEVQFRKLERNGRLCRKGNP